MATKTCLILTFSLIEYLFIVHHGGRNWMVFDIFLPRLLPSLVITVYDRWHIVAILPLE
jgi:hypothetical protein